MEAYLVPASFVAGGICLLVLGGERLVRHAAHLAMSMGVSKTVVGAVVLGFGTSLPELFVSLGAALKDSPDIATGNIVGSNIANVGLVLGFGAVLLTFRLDTRVTRADLPFGILAAVFMYVWVGPEGVVSRTTGVAMLVAFTFYLLGSVRFARRVRTRVEERPPRDRHPGVDVLWILAGLVAIAVGADLLVVGASDAARLLGVSERIIALTMVAVGTSLPELAAIFAAVRKQESELAVGNVMGSNLFNVLFVLGVTAVVRPVPVDPVLAERDLLAMLVFAVLPFPFFARERRIGRIHGGVLLAAYAAYLVWTGGGFGR